MNGPRGQEPETPFSEYEILDDRPVGEIHDQLSGLAGLFGVVRRDGQTFVRTTTDVALADVEAALAAPAPISFGGPALVQKYALPDNPTFDDLVAAVRQLQGLVT